MAFGLARQSFIVSEHDISREFPYRERRATCRHVILPIGH